MGAGTLAPYRTPKHNVREEKTNTDASQRSRIGNAIAMPFNSAAVCNLRFKKEIWAQRMPGTRARAPPAIKRATLNAAKSFQLTRYTQHFYHSEIRNAHAGRPA